jgi:hypothetical protein
MPENADRDEHAVRDVVMQVAHFIDGRRFVALRRLYADEVETDYTSLCGGTPQRTQADPLMALWETRLGPLDATQHLLGPIAVARDGERATAECHVRAYHVLEGAPSGDEWMIAGHYVFELARDGDRWRIDKMKLETFYQTGNRRLLEEAAAAKIS